MARLDGGFNGWAGSGRPTPSPLNIETSALAEGADGLKTLLEQSSLAHLREPLADLTLDSCVTAIAASRTDFLATLKDRGLGLKDRQAVSNAVARAAREGRVGT